MAILRNIIYTLTQIIVRQIANINPISSAIAEKI